MMWRKGTDLLSAQSCKHVHEKMITSKLMGNHNVILLSKRQEDFLDNTHMGKSRINTYVKAKPREVFTYQ